MIIPFLDDRNPFPKALKDIDSNLYVATNLAVNRFEIHDKQAKEGYTMVMRVQEPDGSFRPLDERTLTTIRQIVKKDLAQVIKEIDEHNAKIHKDIASKKRNMIEGIVDDLKYAGKPLVRGYSNEPRTDKGSG